MNDYIFKYLDKRHSIVDGVCTFKDDFPETRINLLFGIKNGTHIIDVWLIDRIGDD